MADAWQVARSSKHCAKTGEEIPPETPYYSALIETDSGLDRLDYTAEAWPEIDKTDFFSYWKNKGWSQKEDKKHPIDYERLLSFFDALENAEDRFKRLLRYVVSLVLVRKRKLRLDDMIRTDEGEDKLSLFDRRDGGKNVTVISPEASREELEQAQEKLNQLFDCDFEEQQDSKEY